jgi:AcrR family transcriptional regulator
MAQPRRERTTPTRGRRPAAAADGQPDGNGTSDGPTRRAGDREYPVGPKAKRTRAALLQSAYELFTTQGYIDTSVAQIAERAGVSLGTFYQYFRDRPGVMAALLADHTAAQIDRVDQGWRADRGRESLYDTVHSFVAWYAEEAAFAKVWEEVCHVDEAVAQLRRDVGRMFTNAVERQLVRASRAGHTRKFTAPEADLAARALTGMVDRFCYVTYVFDPPDGGPPDSATASRLLTDLWADAVGLE